MPTANGRQLLAERVALLDKIPTGSGRWNGHSADEKLSHVFFDVEQTCWLRWRFSTITECNAG